MCGIAGIVELKSSPQPHLIQRMTDQLTHRGPDHGDSVSYPFQEYWMGLGHRRLSVIDLSSQANQPMEYNALTIVFNGEIYNYKQLYKMIRRTTFSSIDSRTCYSITIVYQMIQGKYVKQNYTKYLR